MMNKEVDVYFIDGCGRCELGGTPQCKVHKWENELRTLRAIVNECGLTEESKWGVPVYTWNGKNIATLSALKDYTVLSFFKGSLIKDDKNLLDKPGENTQGARMFRFTDTQTIIKLESDIKAYLFEAIEIEKAGLKVDFKAKDALEYPEELLEIFNSDSIFKEAFESLTPGRQRGYILFFTAPKQVKTKISRIEKFREKILDGKGLHD